MRTGGSNVGSNLFGEKWLVWGGIEGAGGGPGLEGFICLPFTFLVFFFGVYFKVDWQPLSTEVAFGLGVVTTVLGPAIG
jgi:hypothetical protein